MSAAINLALAGFPLTTGIFAVSDCTVTGDPIRTAGPWYSVSE